MNTYFERTLTYNQITFQLTNKPTPDEREIHTYHEILFFISGKAELLSENCRRELKSQALIVIPKETYHFFRLGGTEFWRLKISIPKTEEERLPLSGIMKRLYVREHLSKEMSYILQRLCHILQDTSGEKMAFYAYAVFLMLIAEADAELGKNDPAVEMQNDTISQITQYVSLHLTGDLSVAAIAKAINASPSAVIHTFKKEMGISLHNYITQRRLILAQELIASGQKPSKIYLDCGYLDYSSFYRAYLKFFGYPPSREPAMPLR